MYNRKIPQRQLTAWLATAIIPTSIQVMAGTSWLSVLLLSVLSLLCIWFRWTFGTETRGKLFALFHMGLLTLLLGTGTHEAVQSWPTGASPVVAVVIMGLGAWSAWKGTSAAARVGCVLFWFVLFLYLVLFGAGVKEIEIQWLIPTKGDVSAFGCVLLLTPAAAAMHLKQEGKADSKLVLMGLFCTAAAVITTGVLSPQVAAAKPNAFYEMTRSLNLLGQARRFEAVLSAGMTVGWFAIFSLYLTLCGKYFEIVCPGQGKWGILGGAITAVLILLLDVHIPGAFLLALCAIFWVLLPILTQWIGAEKKS